jgi:hypothetical protein
MNNTTRLLKSIGLALLTTLVFVLFTSCFWWIGEQLFTETLFVFLTTWFLLDLTMFLVFWVSYYKIGVHKFISFDSLQLFYMLSALRSMSNTIPFEDVKYMFEDDDDDDIDELLEVGQLADFIIKFADVKYKDVPFAVSVLNAIEKITGVMLPPANEKWNSVEQIKSFTEFLTENREELEEFLEDAILEIGSVTDLIMSLYEASEGSDE